MGGAYGGTPYPDFPLQRSTPQILDQIERLRPTVVMGIASYLRRLFRIAQEDGRDLSSIRHVWAAGEPTPAGMREDIRGRLRSCGAQDVFVNNGFGFTEAQMQWCDCIELGRCHNPDPSQFYVEVVDRESHERLGEQELGLFTITHLNRRGTVLLRYAIGDLTAVSREPCPWCGRTGDAIVRTVGSTYATRTADLMKIKGELVNPEAIRDRVAKVPGWWSTRSWRRWSSATARTRWTDWSCGSSPRAESAGRSSARSAKVCSRRHGHPRGGVRG